MLTQTIFLFMKISGLFVLQ